MRKVEVIPGDHLANLESCGGVYRAVIDPITQRVVTPLVGYAGKYETPEGLKAYVGNVYYNFAMAEGNPEVLGEFANCLKRRVEDNLNCQVDCVLGAPMGGIALSYALAERLGCHFAFAEKRILALATTDAREHSELVLERHVISRGWKVVLGEDVCNNFSTAKALIELIRARGAEVVAIVCAINRSMNTEGEIRDLYDDGHDIRQVLSALEIPTEQFRQDDQLVAMDIAAGNVSWKPKNEWDELIANMRAAQEAIKA